MWDWISKLNELKESHTAFVLVTVVCTNGSSPRDEGAKMIVLKNGDFFGTIGGGNLEYQAIEEAKALFERENQNTNMVKYPLGAKTGQCCGGTVDLLFELVQDQNKLYIFGAGHVAQAICRVLKDSSFQVHVFDDRKEWIDSPKLLVTDQCRHFGSWDEFKDIIQDDEKKSFAVVMTHRHDLDQEILEYLMSKKLKYLGVIGSKSKFEKFKHRWKFQGIDESHFSKVHCPIGLPIGGKSPTEVAVSFAAELFQIVNQKENKND